MTENLLQIIYPFDEDGRIGKMIANKLIVGPDGQWLLPFWREMGGQDCLQSPSMHGKAGLLISANKVRNRRHLQRSPASAETHFPLPSNSLQEHCKNEGLMKSPYEFKVCEQHLKSS